MKETLVAACVNDRGEPFLYSVNCESSWYESAVFIMKEAMTSWQSQTADKTCGEYTSHAAIAELPEPMWPRVEFRTYLERAFRKHLIQSLDQPIVKQMRGAR